MQIIFCNFYYRNNKGDYFFNEEEDHRSKSNASYELNYLGDNIINWRSK